MTSLLILAPVVLVLAGAAPPAAQKDAPRHGASHNYGDDMLPSAEVTAFRRMDARRHYRDARIGRDRRGCATYEGVARNGRTYRILLSTASGRPICTPR